MPKLGGIPVPHLRNEQALELAVKSVTACLFHPDQPPVVVGVCWFPERQTEHDAYVYGLCSSCYRRGDIELLVEERIRWGN